MAPKLTGAPSAEQLADIECPFQRAATITQIARRCGTLTGPLHRLRVATIVELRSLRDEVTGEPLLVETIADRVGLSPARISQLAPAAEGATQ